MFDLITIGDSVIDTFIPLKNIRVAELEGERFLCLPLGAKIPVGEGKSMVAGNAANNAIGSSRLKLKTAIYTNVGNLDDDRDDDRIKSRLKKEGVDIRYIAENDNLPSNHNIVLSFEGERTILSHHQPWKFHLPDLDHARWIYLTSLSPSFTDSNIVEQIINYLQRSHAKLFFQPGTFQLLQGVKKNSKILSISEVLVLNLEEAKHLLGHEGSKNLAIKKILKSLSDLGPRIVIVTDGREGSYGYEGEKFFRLETVSSKLVEATGAGDAYATGVLAGFFYGKDLEEAMRWGACNGAAVVGQIGPQAGLLSYNKMQEWLKVNKKIVTKEI